MPQPNKVPTDPWMDAHLEAYVDDTLSAEERTCFEIGLRVKPYWRDQVERARDIRTFLRAQSPPSPPAPLTKAILQQATTASPSERDG